MKMLKKVLLILFVAVCFFSIIPQTTVFARIVAGSDAGGNAPQSANGILNSLQANQNGVDSGGLVTVIGKLLGFLQIASALVAVLMIALTGFNYIVGTPEVKDEMKKKMLPIIIGLILVFGAVSIGKFILGATTSSV